MFCKTCGKQIPDGARFCSGCGAIQEETNNNQPPVNGGPDSIPPEFRGVNNTGYNIPMGTGQTPAPGGKKSHTGLIIGIIAAIVVIIAIAAAAFFIISSSNGKADENISDEDKDDRDRDDEDRDSDSDSGDDDRDNDRDSDRDNDRDDEDDEDADDDNNDSRRNNRGQSGFSSYEDLIDQAVDYFEDNDIDGLVSISSDLASYTADEAGFCDDLADCYESNLDLLLRDINYNLGYGYDLDYEITSNYSYTLDDIKDILGYYSDDYDWDTIEKAESVYVDLTAEKDGDEETAFAIFWVVKEDGYWKLLEFL